MRRKQTMSKIIQELKNSENIAYWHEVEAQKSKSVPFPDELNEKIQLALINRGISSLYTHQAEAFSMAIEKKNFVAVTPTASGKTLCYNLPVLQAIANDHQARALYLFPTKALSQDQKSELNEFIDEMGIDIKSYTYDGDTAPNIRQSVRKAGHIVITNPDMLHSGILPHHTKWVSLFENLKFVVLDELHIYRGVFGSHVANVIRRLKRICSFYGSNPQFICTSATIANPNELAMELTGVHMDLIDNNGAPKGRKHFVFYNPPIVNKALHIRKSTTNEVNTLAKTFLENDIQTIVFAKSRVRVEVILSHLQEIVKKEIGTKSIRGYRGGYLPKQRREIEKGLREGAIKGVVSTNALELGIDIGQLQVCILTGYPGSVASTWQQAGRAGRRQGESVVIFVAESNPLDQYMMSHPNYFFERNPETARINPNNLIILVDHLKCAAYELPFKEGEKFGDTDVEEILTFLTEENILHYNNGKWHWMNQSFPAHNISLRSASQDNVIIIDQTTQANVKVIGEMDRFSAMTLLHEEAIYLHEGTQYQVVKLDWEEKKAFVEMVNVDYFTDANLAVQLKVLEEDKKKTTCGIDFFLGEVTVNALPTIFKKIKLSTFDSIGSGPIHLPEEEMHTTSTWFTFNDEVTAELSTKTLETLLIGVSHLLKNVIPVYVMCDRNDIYVVPQVKSVYADKPLIFVYDRYPGGIGLSEEVFNQFEAILNEVNKLIQNCPCESGCPSCIGATSSEENMKKISLHVLERWSLTLFNRVDT